MWKLQVFATTSLVSKAMTTRGKVSSRNYLGRLDVLTEAPTRKNVDPSVECLILDPMYSV